MSEHLISVSLRSSPAPQQCLADTLARYTLSIPVYVIHSFDQPFCHYPRCLCQARKQEAEKFLVQIVEGKLLLEKAEDLLAGRTV